MASRARTVSGSVAETVGPQQVATKDGARPDGIPADACIIISKDLYFTKSQVLVMGGVMLAAYAWGKLS